MKRIALEACKSEDEKADVKDMTLEKLEDFRVFSKAGKNLALQMHLNLWLIIKIEMRRFSVRCSKVLQETYL